MNFQQYVKRHFLTFVQSMISESTIQRLDQIWNYHPDQSLTRLTQENGGCRTKIHGSTPMPGDRLEQFLKTPENKAGLIRFIGQEMVSNLTTFPKYSTKDDQVTVSNSTSSVCLCFVIK